MQGTAAAKRPLTLAITVGGEAGVGGQFGSPASLA
jgi:hypothetical protein